MEGSSRIEPDPAAFFFLFIKSQNRPQIRVQLRNWSIETESMSLRARAQYCNLDRTSAPCKSG